MVFVAWQHSRVTEFGGARRYTFAGRFAPQPTSKKANRAYDSQSVSRPNFPVIDDLGRLGSRFDCGNAGAGRVDRRWTAWRSGETRAETNHPACQDETIEDIETHFSGGNRRVRHGRRGCSDLKASLPSHCGVARGLLRQCGTQLQEIRPRGV